MGKGNNLKEMCDKSRGTIARGMDRGHYQGLGSTLCAKMTPTRASIHNGNMPQGAIARDCERGADPNVVCKSDPTQGVHQQRGCVSRRDSQGLRKGADPMLSAKMTPPRASINNGDVSRGAIARECERGN